MYRFRFIITLINGNKEFWETDCYEEKLKDRMEKAFKMCIDYLWELDIQYTAIEWANPRD